MPRFDSDVVPNATGQTLGEPDARWNAKIKDLDISGIVTGTFLALASGSLGHQVVPFSATPTFDASQASGFEMTLTNNVTSSAITGVRPGTLVAFVIRQDGTGGRAFPWPANVFGGADIGIGANEVTTQLFYTTQTQLIAVTPGNIV